MRTICTALTALIIALSAVSAALGVEYDSEVEALRACMARHAPARTAEVTLDIETQEASGNVRHLAATMYWRRDDDGHSQVLLRVEDPPALRHTAILALERTDGEPELYAYLPELRSVRRMTGRALSGSLFGTDLRYEDVIQLYAMRRDATLERLPDESLDGRAVHVLRAIPAPAVDLAYARITSWIDAETCILRRTRFDDAAGRMVKDMTMPWSDVTPAGTLLVPHVVVIRDHVSGGETRLRTVRARYDEDLAVDLFSPIALARGR